MPRLRKSATSLGMAFGMVAALGTAACDSEGTEQTSQFQCAVERGGQMEAVSCDDVDDGGHVHHGGMVYPVWIYSMPINGSHVNTYHSGTKLPGGGHKISYNDPAARTKWGLPANGKVANGTVKTNIVGKGGAPVGNGGGAKGGGNGGSGKGGGGG